MCASEAVEGRMNRGKAVCGRTSFLNAFDSSISDGPISGFEGILGALNDGSRDEWRSGEYTGASQWQDSAWCNSEERHGWRWFERYDRIGRNEIRKVWEDLGRFRKIDGDF